MPQTDSPQGSKPPAAGDAPPPAATRLIVLTAPSGAGKTTIARQLLREMPEARFSVSATTRAARPGEVDGTHYHFLSQDDFQRRVEAGEMVEYEEVYPGQFYGTLHSELERGDAPVVLDIDVKGAASIKQRYDGRALVIFVRPPSKEVLAERLRGRGTEASADLDKRLRRAEMELRRAEACDAVVVNDDLADAVQETLRLVRSFVTS